MCNLAAMIHGLEKRFLIQIIDPITFDCKYNDKKCFTSTIFSNTLVIHNFCFSQMVRIVKFITTLNTSFKLLKSLYKYGNFLRKS